MVETERGGSNGSASAYKDYIAGSVAGLATVTAGHPFDTVKVMLQKHNAGSDGVKYKNAFHCSTRILQTQGVKGLYRGATPSFIGVSLQSSFMFGLYSQTKRFLQGGETTDRPQVQVVFPSAAFAGALISFVLCPMDLIKCRIQVQGTDSSILDHQKYRSPLDCAVKTARAEGITGVFRGGVSMCMRESIGNGVFFTVYEQIRYYLSRSVSGDSKLIDMGIGILSGGLGGVACWCVILPVDVAKTIIQTAPDRAFTRNPFSVLRMIYRDVGVRGWYTGLGPTMARAFPANAATIVTWELARKLLYS